MLKCFAIYIPHITEEIYQGYYVNHEPYKSIHISKIEPIEVSNEFNEKEYGLGKTAIKIISELRKYKSENNLSLKTELEKVVVKLPKDLVLGRLLRF